MSSLLKSLTSPPQSRRSSVSVSIPDIPPTNKPFLQPADGCGPKSAWKYTKEQQDKIEELRIYAFSLLLPESDPYHPWEKRFLSDPGCIPRYMRASKWRLPEGKTRIKGTMEWRREFKPELIKGEEVREDVGDGKIVLFGFDKDGRPIIIMRPGKEKRPSSDHGLTQIKHLVWHLERAIDLAPPGVETVSILIDYASASSSTNPSIGTARKVLNILQNHYVERMGRGIIVRMPWWVNAFFTAVTPFLDPVTKEKVKFNPKLTDLIPASQLEAEFGGEVNFQFEPEIWFKEITEYCHLSKDGGRLDKDGNPTVPPYGYGAKAACYGLEAAGGLPQLASREAEVPVGMTPANLDESKKVNPMDQILLPETVPERSEKEMDQAEKRSSTEEEGISSGEKDIPMVAVTGPTSTMAAKSEEAKPRGSVDAITGTAPGPPISEATFDHPPDEEEKKMVEKIEGITLSWR